MIGLRRRVMRSDVEAFERVMEGIEYSSISYEASLFAARQLLVEDQ